MKKHRVLSGFVVLIAIMTMASFAQAVPISVAHDAVVQPVVAIQVSGVSVFGVPAQHSATVSAGLTQAIHVKAFAGTDQVTTVVHRTLPATSAFQPMTATFKQKATMAYQRLDLAIQKDVTMKTPAPMQKTHQRITFTGIVNPVHMVVAQQAIAQRVVTVSVRVG